MVEGIVYVNMLLEVMGKVGLGSFMISMEIVYKNFLLRASTVSFFTVEVISCIC